MPRNRASSRTIYIATALSMLVFGAGYALASITITTGSEAGTGNFTNANSLAYWSQAGGLATGLGGVPSGLTTLSGTVGTPTVLAGASQSYAINAPTAGDVGQFIKFSETSAATINTEIEIAFTVSTGGGPAITNVVVYIETQASAPGSTLTFTLYYDLGSASGGSIVVNSIQQISQTCTAVGTCA